MKVFCSSFFPVMRTFSAFTTITKSPVSTCGVKTLFSFPRKRFAALTATRPRTLSFASMIHHLRGTSAALAEKVFIRGGKRHGNYGRGREVSTLLTAESTSRSRQRQRRMAPGMLYRNYNASRRPFTHRLFALCHVFVSCRPKLVSRNSRSSHSRGNHPRNETGPTKSGALCDAPPTTAPELFRWGLFVAGQCSLAHTRRRSRALLRDTIFASREAETTTRAFARSLSGC